MLLRHPVCIACKELGIYTPTDEIDHVVPLHRGGADHEDNLQGLCKPCHDAKTAIEGGHDAQRVSNHPDWLEKSAIPLKIVCGPPCAGKSTLVRATALAGDLIIDLDDIMLELDPSYRPWTGNRDRLNDAIRIRNRMLGSLARPQHLAATQAWFIVSAPSPDERAWWQSKLGGELILIHPGVQECKRRARQRETPGAILGIDEWEARSRKPWQRTNTRIPVDADGWPKG